MEAESIGWYDIGTAISLVIFVLPAFLNTVYMSWAIYMSWAKTGDFLCQDHNLTLFIDYLPERIKTGIYDASSSNGELYAVVGWFLPLVLTVLCMLWIWAILVFLLFSIALAHRRKYKFINKLKGSEE